MAGFGGGGGDLDGEGGKVGKMVISGKVMDAVAGEGKK